MLVALAIHIGISPNDVCQLVCSSDHVETVHALVLVYIQYAAL